MQSLSDVPSTSAKTMLIDYLKQNRALFSLSELERVVGCPKGTIHQAVNDRQELPDKWVEPLFDVFMTTMAYPMMDLSIRNSAGSIATNMERIQKMLFERKGNRIEDVKAQSWEEAKQDFINATQLNTNENHQ